MISRNYLLFLLLALSVNLIEARQRVQNQPCQNREDCEDLNNTCRCYCSRMCGFREREANDAPIYVEDDPAGNHCYCRQWDLDNYEARCQR